MKPSEATLMAGQNEYESNQLAYRRLKDTINRTYAKGWFVGVADDKVIGAAESFRDLERSLLAQGKDPRKILVVEAGIEAPDYVTVFI